MTDKDATARADRDALAYIAQWGALIGGFRCSQIAHLALLEQAGNMDPCPTHSKPSPAT